MPLQPGSPWKFWQLAHPGSIRARWQSLNCLTPAGAGSQALLQGSSAVAPQAGCFSGSTLGSGATSTSAPLPPSEGGVTPSAEEVRRASLCLGPGKPSDLSSRRSHPCGAAIPSSRSRRSTTPLTQILRHSSSFLLAMTSHRQQRLYRKSKNPIQEQAERCYWTLAVSNIRIEMVGMGRQKNHDDLRRLAVLHRSAGPGATGARSEEGGLRTDLRGQDHGHQRLEHPTWTSEVLGRNGRKRPARHFWVVASIPYVSWNGEWGEQPAGAGDPNQNPGQAVGHRRHAQGDHHADRLRSWVCGIPGVGANQVQDCRITRGRQEPRRQVRSEEDLHQAPGSRGASEASAGRGIRNYCQIHGNDSIHGSADRPNRDCLKHLSHHSTLLTLNLTSSFFLSALLFSPAAKD